MITIQDIKQILIYSMESDFPDTILKKLRIKQGKRFDKRTIDMLNIELPNHNFRKKEGCLGQSLHWGAYGDYQDINIINSTGPQLIDCEWIEHSNIAYFSARRERNKQREALLNDAYTLEEIVSKGNRILILKNTLSEMNKGFASLLNIHSAETHTIKALIGE